MKKIIMLLCLLATYTYSQSQSSMAGQVAGKIAQKMKDSLALSEAQRLLIYDVNIQLYNNKAALRQQYSNTDTLSLYTQKVENTRDSLYHAVLPDEKYLLYKQKKKNLVNNNR